MNEDPDVIAKHIAKHKPDYKKDVVRVDINVYNSAGGLEHRLTRSLIPTEKFYEQLQTSLDSL